MLVAFSGNCQAAGCAGFLTLDLNFIFVAGERNAATLITMRDTRCKSNVETTQNAQVGNTAGRAMLRTPKRRGAQYICSCLIG